MTDSSTIYKYRTWEDPYHKACLIYNEFYFASPLDINDPFDCTTTIDYSLLDTDEKIEKYADKVIQEAGLIADTRNETFRQKRIELVERLKKEPDKLQSEFDITSQKWINKYYGVLSFSTRWDSILMWTHYSQNHKGFCIGLNKEKLISTNKLGISGPVHYANFFPKIDPLETPMINANIQQMNTKAVDWHYEQEYRFTNIFDKQNLTAADRRIRFANDFIEEIIVGLNIPLNDLKEIKQFADTKKIPLYKIIKKSRTFLLDKERL